MKKIEKFTNLYSVSKTLRFKAIPIGKTQENIARKRLLEEDASRAEKYAKAKKIIDRYHVEFIDRVMSEVNLTGLTEYMELFLKSNKSDEEKDLLVKKEVKLREEIANAFIKDPDFKTLSDKSLIETVLPKKLTNDEEKEIIAEFVGFTTAFGGYNLNRQNMYSKEPKSTAISYRCINENLPMFISNIKSFEKIKEKIGTDVLNKINEEICPDSYRIQDCFDIEFFSFVLSSDGIRLYNTFIGGYTKEDGTKIKGLNEYVNLYNQKVSKTERLPRLKMLYKLMLTDSESISFVLDKFANDQELIKGINKYIEDNNENIGSLCGLLSRINDYNLAGIVIKNGPAITNISNEVVGNWNIIQNSWNKEYDAVRLKNAPKDWEKYDEDRRKAYKKIGSFTIEELNNLIEISGADKKMDDVASYYVNKGNMYFDLFEAAQKEAHSLLAGDYPENKKLSKDERSVAIIKQLLDIIKDIELLVKPLMGEGTEIGLDELFYGELYSLYESVSMIDKLYDKVRDYVTSKPYSTDKYKLYFQNPQFMGGWDRNKVSDYRATLLRKDNLYYLLVMDKSDSKILSKLPDYEGGEAYELLDFKVIPGASKQLPHIFFSRKGIEEYRPSEEILRIKNEGTFKKGDNFSKEDCKKIIDYYKSAITQSEMNQHYAFCFSDTDSYEDISGFFREVDQQGYKIGFSKIDGATIDKWVDEGKVYLFQIYNKDFSKYSHGKENLHTMIFKEVFNEANNGCIKLCGDAEFFFRKASISKEDRIIHPSKQPIKNKNKLNTKKESTFDYDLIKDKRYTQDQYEIHIPVMLNRTAIGATKINETVRKELQMDTNPYIIGIDRGERNLIYICVIDGKGKIVEQLSLNEIVNEYCGGKAITDYHQLLDSKEKERKADRENWRSIKNIKELKEGYISQVVHKICCLVQKYDAVIAMEDLNSGFKNSRVKVEKQVYQNFEKALITKLNYLSSKETKNGVPGSITNGYQLTNLFTSFKDMRSQNGFIFYIPAWLTSKIDPVTGFADLIKPKYSSVENTHNFIRSFDKIAYDKEEDLFVFNMNMERFDRTDADYNKKWTLYSYGDRIRSFRNPEKNSEWDYEVVNVTDEFKKLMDTYNITYSNGNDLIELLCSIDKKDFCESFIQTIRIMLQMRNSISGRTDVDYLISPVKDGKGSFYDSRNCSDKLPQDADANGAYNIARKVLWAIGKFKEVPAESVGKVKLGISNKEWLEFVQKNG